MDSVSKTYITITMDEGDDVYTCIRQTMQDNKLIRCNAETCSGNIKEGSVNRYTGTAFRPIDIVNMPIARVSGPFILRGGVFTGTLNIFSDETRPLTGNLLKGTAAQDFMLKLSFIK